MKKILYDTFKQLKNDYPDFRIIGRNIMFSLDEERYIKLNFTERAKGGTYSTNRFNGVELSLVSRNRGLLDNQMIAFVDVFENVLDMNHINQLEKCIWICGKGFEWYGKPDQDDIQNLLNEVKEYADFTSIKKDKEKTVYQDLSALDETIQQAEKNNIKQERRTSQIIKKRDKEF